MLGIPFVTINKAAIDYLIANKVAESKTLEYKERLPGGTKDEVKEFLSDVSSFANASGGDLVYGIKAERDDKNITTGKPEAALGIGDATVDKITQRLESMILADIEPRLHGFQVIPVEGFPKGPVIVIRIAQSWSGPHMVKKGDSRFYSRMSSRKYALDVEQIRAAFTLSEGLSEKIRSFRDGRVARIVAGETPVPVGNTAKAVLHVIPLSSLAPAVSVPFEFLSERPLELQPFATTLKECRYNLDGFLTYNVNEQSGQCRGYSQLFRNGAIEGMNAVMLEPYDPATKIISSLSFEKPVLQSLHSYLTLEKKLGVQPPIVVMLSLLGVKGYQMYAGIMASEDFERKVDRENLLLPDVLLESFDTAPAILLRPVFHALWQACGFPGCPHYDKDGNRKPNT